MIVDSPILVQGQLQKDEKNLKILADMIVPMEKVEETWTASIHFNLQLAVTGKDSLVKLRNIFTKYPGTCNGFIHLVNDGKTDTIFSISDQLRLKACKALTRDVNLLTGYDSVKTVCSPARLVPKKNDYRGNNQKRRYHNA